MVERYRHHYLSHDHELQLFDGVAELIAELSAAGFLLAVATGKSRHGLDRALQLSGLGKYFHASRCADECFSKPHPQMLEELLEELSVDPGGLYDRRYDARPADGKRTPALPAWPWLMARIPQLRWLSSGRWLVMQGSRNCPNGCESTPDLSRPPIWLTVVRGSALPLTGAARKKRRLRCVFRVASRLPTSIAVGMFRSNLTGSRTSSSMIPSYT
jgi:hypothetical protein